MRIGVEVHTGKTRHKAAAYEPDRIVVITSSEVAGMLVLSEVYYPAWNAYVDGQPAHVYLADGALRAVAVPAGEHTVEFRFESATMMIGSAISVGTILLLATLLLVSPTTDRVFRRRTPFPLGASTFRNSYPDFFVADQPVHRHSLAA